ncbi:MAG: acetylglutamate kinase [Pseudomonadales bacterium]|jgi:acetylglutamate kinase
MIDQLSSNVGLKPLAVIKVGGDILLDDTQQDGLAKNIMGLIEQDWRVVVLHGGGPQLSSMQARCGLESRKVAGRRITSKEDLVLVKQVLCGQVNVDLVSILQAQGVNAFGCHGASGKLIRATRRPPILVSGGGGEPINFGEVGDVTSINTDLLNSLLAADLVPVIASLGINDNGDVFNINADTTVVQIAREMSAELLIFVTGIGGIFKDIKDPASRFAQLDSAAARKLIDSGIIVDGMIPKVEEALSLLESGVDTIAIVDTRDPLAFTSIASGETQFGTLISNKA